MKNDKFEAKNEWKIIKSEAFLKLLCDTPFQGLTSTRCCESRRKYIKGKMVKW